MTQQELIEKYMRDFGSITPYEAFKDLRITKLSTRISEMKKKGFEFADEWVDDVNRYGVAVKYKRYRLIKSVIVPRRHSKIVEQPKKKSFWQRFL